MLRQSRFSRFTHRAAASLRACGFTPPHANHARVVVFDSAPWWPLRDDAANLLSPYESARAARFRHALDHDTYTVAHAFWRVALGMVLNTDPASVDLARSPDGQPLLPGTGLTTSLSHSGTMVALAIARGAAIGVDIEGFPSRTRLQDIAGILCTPAEAQTMSTLEGEARDRALLELWTRKEALLKAFGTGLRIAPATIDADIDRVIQSPDGIPRGQACRLYPLSMPIGWLGALALGECTSNHSLHHV
ncbi:4'-phosphopantetheinyl transferase family protein [Dyella japonica]|uniref:4'-phosphopantetheinyl transferase family protein n=1 Tax=Dyella japonica TaxID=231455 RepID=UPI0002EBC183|nr:4'-phosphopantetheinyl transferase superfamily protein [Dyella japonica]